jgi:hypothetical protein
LNDNFAFCKETNGFLTLGVQYAKERVLHSTEWEECHGRYYSNIYANIAAGNPILKFSGGFTT